MLKNKKGAIFWYTILLGVILILGIAILVTPEPAVNYIGEKPLNIISTSIQMEKIMQYIDQSAKFSSYKSIYDISSNSGFAEKEKCGKLQDYNLWNNKDKIIEDCFPDYENNFKLIFDKHLQEYLASNPDYLISVNYNYILTQEPKLNIVGIAEEEVCTTAEALVKKKLSELIPSYESSKDEENLIKIIKEKYSSEIRSAIQKVPSNAPKPSEALIVAIIMAESGGDEKAISSAGCRGLGQACYLTAQDYIDIFGFLTPCDCIGEECKTAPKCDDSNDARGDSHKSIMFIAAHMSNLMKIFKDYTSQEEFAVLSYNAGQTVIKSAIKKTGKKDPAWAEIYPELTPDLITYFKTLKEKENKVREIKNYLLKVLSYKEIYEKVENPYIGAAIISPKIGTPRTDFIGSYSLKPNFKVNLDFDLTIFEEIKEKSKQLIEKCSEETNLESCIDGNIILFNKESEIEWTNSGNSSRTFKFEVNTHKKLFPFEEEVIIKFALYFPESTVT